MLHVLEQWFSTFLVLLRPSFGGLPKYLAPTGGNTNDVSSMLYMRAAQAYARGEITITFFTL